MTPTPGDEPGRGASPWTAAASTSCWKRTPASTRAVVFAASIVTPAMRRVLIRSVSSAAATEGPCPVLRTAMFSSCRTAKRTAAATSAVLAAPTTTAGRWVTDRLNTAVSSSYPSSPGVRTGPLRSSASRPIADDVFIALPFAN
jgi:hypothetical protein